MIRRASIHFLLAAAVTSCGADERPHTEPSPAHVLSRSVKTVKLEIDYAPDAAPFTGNVGFAEPFQLAEHNLEALFEGSPKELILPETLDEMDQIDVPPGPYTGNDLLRIADDHRDDLGGGDRATFYAVWLDGYYENETGVANTVLGAALPDYGIIAMFKPAIDPLLRGEGSAVASFTEQSAFIHELGHVLGLVNTGLPEVDAHEDLTNPGHCNDPDCVMYWANEGSADLFRFVTQRVRTGSDVLFDAACLADARAAARR